MRASRADHQRHRYLTVDVQPQTARHEGYETAFGGLMGGMPDVTVRVF